MPSVDPHGNRSPSSVRLAFGPFEVNAPTGELFKSGHRVRLPDQPFQILLMLLAHPGDLVTREQLCEQIWSEGTFVDFDHGLSAAVHKVRLALSDSAENPHYIETVPGRGYRFIGTIEPRFSAPSPSATNGDMLTSVSASAQLLAPVSVASRRKFIAPAALAVLVASVGLGYLYFRRPPKLTDKDTIVLADVINTTGDPIFDGTLRQGLAIQLEQSPFLSLVSEERIQRTMPLMGQPPGARVSPQLARQICERTGSAAFLEGSIASLGSQYVLGLRAKNCRTGDILDEEQAQAARKEDILNALSQIASKFRTRIGESLATIRKHETPLAEATTPSLEALKAYSAAFKAAYTIGSPAALPFLQRAIEIDPDFAVAHAYLGRVYGDLGESVPSVESTVKAYQLRDRASDQEKFFITFSYQEQVTGNLEKAQQTGEWWAQTYPRDLGSYGFMSGVIYQSLAEYEKSMDAAKTALGIDPDFTFGYVNLGYTYFYLDRLAEAESTLQQASERKLEIPDLLVLRYYLAFLKDDKAGMERAIARSQGKPLAEDWMSHSEALVLARSGHLELAKRMSLRAVDLAQQAGQRERAALYEIGMAVWQAFYGNATAARRNALDALAVSRGRDVEYGAAFALALAGDSARSQSLANDLEKRFPEDTYVRFTYLPAIHGLLALRRGKFSNAIELLQTADPYELGVPGTAFIGFFGSLYPAYIRGEAYLAARQGSKAAAEFHKVIDHRGIVAADPIGALAHLQLGRALDLSGDKIKAKAAYQDFLTLWKDADPNIPILKQAKAEYARLH